MSIAKKITDSHRAAFFMVGLVTVAAAGLWGDEFIDDSAASLIADVRNPGPNEAAINKATQNYYGELLSSETEDTTILEVAPHQEVGDVPDTRHETIQKSGATNNRTGNFLPWELRPGSDVIFKGVSLVVNEYGNCDGDGYTMEKPKGTFRIALVGGSNTMGSGVAIEDTFGSIIQDRLNKELAGGAYKNYEIINFAVGGYHLPESLYVVENKVGDFDPDLILVNATDKDFTIQHERLARRVEKRDPIHFKFLKQILEDAEIDRDMDPMLRMIRKLYPFREEIILGCLRELYQYSRSSGTEVVIFLLRRDGGPRIHPDLLQTLEVFQQGDLKVIPLFESYEGVGPMDLWLIAHENPELGDPHPNMEGHRRIAEELYTKLLDDDDLGPVIRGEGSNKKRRNR